MSVPTLTNNPAASALGRDLRDLLKRHAEGERPSQEMVATMAFLTGYLFFHMPDGGMTAEDLSLFVLENIGAGASHAAEGVVKAHGGRN